MTDTIVYAVILTYHTWKDQVWFGRLKNYIKLDGTVLRKSLERLKQYRLVEEYRLIGQDRRGRKKGYKGFRAIRPTKSTKPGWFIFKTAIHILYETYKDDKKHHSKR